VQAEQVTDVCTFHGEGAVWSPSWGGLRFVDMLAGDVLALVSDSSVRRWSVGAVAACVRPRAASGWVVAVERGFALYDADDRLEQEIGVWQAPELRMNEGSCDPDGRFWCGSTAYDETPGAGAMHRLEVDGSTTKVFGGLTIPNGLGFTADGRTAYHTDSPTGEIRRYDYDLEHGLVDPRLFVRIPGDVGVPDGLTVDAAGRVWVAVWDGGQVRCYSSTGSLEAVVEVPARRTTSCTFGGARLDRLYVTTSRKGLGDRAEPGAGAVFVAEVGAVGQPVQAFAG
jgi:sugar lactone lactonase YvrE